MGEIPGLFQRGPAKAMHDRGAMLSADGVYRYRLWRVWDPTRALTAFLMLNPSTADATVDDPTVRRCVAFARRWGSGGVEVVNLFAFRATSPDELARAHREGRDVRGPARDKHLREVFAAVDQVVCAWGAHALAASEAPGALALIPRGVNVWCLGATREGHPRHPLYLRGDTARSPFTLRSEGGSHG